MSQILNLFEVQSLKFEEAQLFLHRLKVTKESKVHIYFSQNLFDQ